MKNNEKEPFLMGGNNKPTKSKSRIEVGRKFNKCCRLIHPTQFECSAATEGHVEEDKTNPAIWNVFVGCYPTLYLKENNYSQAGEESVQD